MIQVPGHFFLQCIYCSKCDSLASACMITLLQSIPNNHLHINTPIAYFLWLHHVHQAHWHECEDVIRYLKEYINVCFLQVIKISLKPQPDCQCTAKTHIRNPGSCAIWSLSFSRQIYGLILGKYFSCKPFLMDNYTKSLSAQWFLLSVWLCFTCAVAACALTSLQVNSDVFDTTQSELSS